MSNILSTDNSVTRLNQTCSACTASSNCWRCMATNVTACISCMFGSYLDTTTNTCVTCPTNCLYCLSADICVFCANGFLDTQVGTIKGDIPIGPQNCTACSTSCATCLNNPSTCTSCNSGFTLVSDACISNFNYRISATFAVTLAVFSQNFFDFVQRIADTAGVQFDQVVILSIVQGSVTVNMAVTSLQTAGSNAAVTTQNNLNNAISSGSAFGGMTVASSTLTTQGGSNDE